jgi:hypothetical protein
MIVINIVAVFLNLLLLTEIFYSLTNILPPPMMVATVPLSASIAFLLHRLHFSEFSHHNFKEGSDKMRFILTWFTLVVSRHYCMSQVTSSRILNIQRQEIVWFCVQVKRWLLWIFCGLKVGSSYLPLTSSLHKRPAEFLRKIMKL